MKKYYHGSFHQKTEFNQMKPDDYYEKINEVTGCPEAIYADNYYIGFPISKIPELSFSKSIGGAILGKGAQCNTHMWQPKRDAECIIDVYATSEKPDVDISDCAFDFAVLEEVRYRKKTSVKRENTVRLSKRMVSQIEQVYPGEVEPDTWLLGCLKKHVHEQIKKGGTDIPGLTDLELDECYASGEGMTVSEYREFSRLHDDK